MNARLVDVVIGVVSFLILIALLAALPIIMSAGAGYLLAITIFILVLSYAGYAVNEKIT